MADLPPLPDTPTGRYRHYKGGEYEVIGVARHSETLEPLVVYRPLYNDSGLWLRPHAMFFGEVEVDGKKQPRFAQVAASKSERSSYPVAVIASEAPPRTKPSNYPEPFASQMAGRQKRPLGDLFGLTNFGVNFTRLAPSAVSTLRHAHSSQDEFVYILQGHPTLHTDEGRTRLAPGMCAGFKAGTGNAHRLINDTAEEVVYLEAGDRTGGDEASYPDDDIQAQFVDGAWKFVHKDGSPYSY
jgi:uncharacterized cupin superfamily protein